MKAELSDYQCRNCGSDLAIVRSTDDHRDRDGDVVLCVQCGFVGCIDIDEDGDLTIIETED